MPPPPKKNIHAHNINRQHRSAVGTNPRGYDSYLDKNKFEKTCYIPVTSLILLLIDDCSRYWLSRLLTFEICSSNKPLIHAKDYQKNTTIKKHTHAKAML